MGSIIPLLTEFEKQSISERQALPEKYLGLPDTEMDARISAAREKLGDKLVILGHHYQRDEVIKFADYIGDSFKLSRQVANRPEADYVVFCGVHFMAESADVLSAPHQQVVLPDLAAGCSMADMAEPEQLENCWEELSQMGIKDVVPVTYINSAAAIKSFVGERGGTVCTSSNAMATLKWGFEHPSTSLGASPSTSLGASPSTALGASPSTALGASPSTALGASPPTALGASPPTALGAGPSTSLGAGPSTALGAGGRKILFLPDQHLGRNTAYKMGIPLDEMVVWNPHEIFGGLDPEQVNRAKMILWKGHCSVHERFTVAQIAQLRKQHPGIRVIVHPEVPWEVVQAADDSGSTEYIIKTVKNSPAGSTWAVGTEVHLVNRLANEVAPERTVLSLDQFGCLCSTMFRVSPNHLLWILEELVEGRVHNRIVVPDGQKHWTRVALERMLSIS